MADGGDGEVVSWMRRTVSSGKHSGVLYTSSSEEEFKMHFGESRS